MRSFEFLRSPDNAVYNKLLTFALEHCPTFSLEWSTSSDPQNRYWDLLLPFAVEPPLERGDKEMLVVYRVCGASVAILREADSLWDWQLPERPEDLALLAPNGDMFVGSIAHEGEAWCDPTVFPEMIVRPLMMELHATDFAPHPDHPKRVAPYGLPDKTIEELRATVEQPGPGYAELFRGNLDPQLQRAVTERMTAYAEYWHRRVARREVPTESDLAADNGIFPDLNMLIGNAAQTDMLVAEDCRALLELPIDERARTQLRARLLIEELREGADPNAVLEALIALLVVPVHQNTVSALINPSEGAVTWALYAAVGNLQRAALLYLGDRIERISSFNTHERTQLRSAIESRLRSLSPSESQS